MAGSGGEWAEGAAVWFQPAGAPAPLPGELVEVHRAARVLLVSCLVNQQPQTFALQMGNGEEEGDPVWPREELGPTGVEDMTRLHDLHEAALLWNLKMRYEQGLIYTYAGSILVAVNPYRPVDALYGLQTARRYHAAEALGDLPPHLFAIAAAARASLPHPQAILISGESGAGKTESTKLAVQFLAAVAPAPPGRAPVSEQILEAAPLLEAFGNARTPKNHNSSRFGKLLELYFKDGALAGARVAHYLLEKSRIVTQSPGERNYHVFYELLAGLDEEQRRARGLLSPEHYFYLNQGGDSGGAGAGADWSALCGAMQVLGIGDSEREDIIRVLSAVLHLGNVYFHRRQLRHGQEGVQLGGGAEVRWAAHLLKVPAEAMARALTTRVTAARAERMRSPLPIDQALDARDAFAKALYSSLFNWLVLRINSIVHRAGLHDAHRISLLDIFGFEDLEENSFEQLCINFANETLQHYFNKHIFKLEQQEYQKERLEWSNLTWNDNSPVIQLLSKKPVGILHLLDDESNFPRASDASFLEKCHYNHALNELYSRPRLGASEFGVKHYAGQVWYNVEGFLDKNRDALRPDVLELLCSSEVPLVSEMSAHLRAQHDNNKTLPRGANGRFVTMKPRTPTVAARFSDSLHQLLESMSRCQPWFVRCLKPNVDKSPLRFDLPCVLAQLRYTGMLDTIKIRQTGYPIRIPFQNFVDRYRYLLKSTPARSTPYREICNSILAEMPSTGADAFFVTMVKSCCVASCNVSGDEVEYFKFPVSKALRAAWLGACGGAGAVCAAHFADADYRSARGPRRLRATAVPSVGLPQNSSLIEKETNKPTVTTAQTSKTPTKSKKKGGKKKNKKASAVKKPEKNLEETVDKEIVNTTEKTVDKEKVNTTENTVDKEKVNTTENTVDKEKVNTTEKTVDKEKVNTTEKTVDKEKVNTTEKKDVEKEKLKTIQNKEAGISHGAICVKENGKVDATSDSVLIEENDVEQMITNYQIQTKCLGPEPLQDLTSILGDHFRAVSKNLETLVPSRTNDTSLDTTGGQLDHATVTRIANRLAGELDVQLNYPMPGLMGMNPMSDVIELDPAPVFIEVPVEQSGSRAASPEDCLMVLESVQCDVDPGSLMMPDSGSDMEILDVPDDKPSNRKKKSEAISLLTSSDEDEVIIQEPKIDTVEVSDDTDEDDRPLLTLITKPKPILKPKRKSVFGMYQYYCEQCTYKTDDESNFKKHNTDLDHSTPLQICTFCSYTTASRVQFARHKRKHRDERNFKCHFCNYKARHNMSLMYHLKSHNPPPGRMPKFSCERCGFYSDVKAEGLNHIKTCRDGRFLCDSCDYSTKRKSDLKRHMRRRHDADDDEDFSL